MTVSEKYRKVPRKFVVGDKVISLQFGSGMVVNVTNFEVSVSFKAGTRYGFNPNGKMTGHRYRTLFLTEELGSGCEETDVREEHESYFGPLGLGPT